MKNHVCLLAFAIAALLPVLCVNSAAAGPAQVGAIVQFGGYDWRVLDVQSNKALIITEHVIERRPYYVEWKAVTWETCTLREYLNGEFLQKFTPEDQGRIAETRIKNPNNLWYGTNGGNDTTDKIFLLSLEEVVKYFGDSGQLRNRPGADAHWIIDKYNSARTAYDSTGKATPWWLRSPGEVGASVVDVGGDSVDGDDEGIVYVIGGNVHANGGVRPALWLNSSRIRLFVPVH